MAQPDQASEQPPHSSALSPLGKIKRRFFGGHHNETPSQHLQKHALLDENEKQDIQADLDDPVQVGSRHRSSRKVITGLPRTQTFKRQQSEQRVHLTPVETDPYERRAVSVDRRSRGPAPPAVFHDYGNPRASAPGHINTSSHTVPGPEYAPSLTASTIEDASLQDGLKLNRIPTAGDGPVDEMSVADGHSMTTSQYDAMIQQELESTWILNLSMHFRDRSKREKFFVTYREHGHLWRRVTISLDYRNATPNSLEWDLTQTEFQRDKSAKIYEAIRESLPEIQFYDTVTNLKLQTVDGRLIVHVVEDGNEIISYPRVSSIKYLGCKRVKERDIGFESHMSGFVYKVNVNGRVLIKKEIPSPETIDEFLYEVNALNSLRYSDHVVKFYGVVVDDDDEVVKGLLISYAEQGALIDIIYDNCKDRGNRLPWALRERWARQIVQGLADIHESGFVQGDFTLSNIVIDNLGNAKIIDINRRGCPVGWEPPEATALIESNQRISMYIGVKSDLYQLGMVLWGIAMEEDEPEREGRPLVLGPEVQIPDWYRRMTEDCLSYDPRARPQASSLIERFPPTTVSKTVQGEPSPISVDNGHTLHEYVVEGYNGDGHPFIREVEPTSEWPSYMTRRYLDPSPSPYEPYAYTRGRSPPSPLPSNCGDEYDFHGRQGRTGWAANINIAPSYSDIGADDMYPAGEMYRQPTPTPTVEKGLPAVSMTLGDNKDDVKPHDNAQPPQATSELQDSGDKDPNEEQNAQEVLASTQISEETDGEDAVARTPDTIKAVETTIQPGLAAADDTSVTPQSDAELTDTAANVPTVCVMAVLEPSQDDQIDQVENAQQELEGGSEDEVEAKVDELATALVEEQGGNKGDSKETNSEIEDATTPGKTEPDDAAGRAADVESPPEKDSPAKQYDAPAPSEPSVTAEGEKISTEAIAANTLQATDVPDTLAGVGSVHLTTDDPAMREKGLTEKDFDDAARLDAASMPTITTDIHA